MMKSAVAATAVLYIAVAFTYEPFLLVSSQEIPAAAAQAVKYWIDSDTPKSAYTVQTTVQSKPYVLVASDEFNKPNRKFENGVDKMWTALDQDDVTNEAQEYMSPSAVTTVGGNLVMTLSTKPAGTKKYTGAHIQSWNKFCFTGGRLEFRAKLPSSEGVWPALWTIGNLGRAQFEKSTKNVWPFSYNFCDPIAKKQQKINACNASPGHGLNPRQGRGAPEIDILEGWMTVPQITVSSLQVAPSIPFYFRPPTTDTPINPEAGQPGSWYRGVTYGETNNNYLGNTDPLTYFTDAVTAKTSFKPEELTNYNLFILEWVPGENGVIKIFLNTRLVISMTGDSLGKYCDPGNSTVVCTQQRLIPEEPLSVIINLALGSATSWAGGPEKATLPTQFAVDYMRVYQPPDRINLGCDNSKYPTKQYIEDFHDELYGFRVKPLPPTESSYQFFSKAGAIKQQQDGTNKGASSSAQSFRSFATLPIHCALCFVLLNLVSLTLSSF